MCMYYHIQFYTLFSLHHQVQFLAFLSEFNHFYNLWQFPARIGTSLNSLDLCWKIGSFLSSHYIVTLVTNREQCNKGAEYSETSLQRTPSGPRKSVCYREVSATQRFIPNWLILSRKLSLGCQGMAKSTSNSAKRIFGRKTIYSILPFVIENFQKKLSILLCFKAGNFIFWAFSVASASPVSVASFSMTKNESNHRGVEVLLMQ